MYLAGLIVTGSGLFAATQYLGDDPFARLVFGLTVLGFIVSFVSRQQNVSPRNIELPALIICGCVFLTGLMSDQPFLAPASIGDDRHRSLAVLLTWLTVFRSYTLINDGALLFCCVPTIALIGLIGTNMADDSLITTFVVFVAAAAFLMVHENFLRTRASRPQNRRTRRPPSMVGSQLQVAGVCVAASVFLANIVVVPLRNILTQVQVSAGIPTINRPAPVSTTVTPVSIKEEGEVRIGNGPVTTSEQIVMRVKTDLEDPYWRGSTYNKYTGHGWQSELMADHELTPISGAPRDGGAGIDGVIRSQAQVFEVPKSPISDIQGPHAMAHQSVQLQGATFDTLYAAAEPRRITMAAQRAASDVAGKVQVAIASTSVDYDVDSEVSAAGPSELRKSSGPYPEEIRNLYLQLPPDAAMVSRWKQAAQQASSGETTQYGRVGAIARWIGNECKYNLKAEAVPEGQDVVDTFLFKQKQGYCDSFASSLAMLCRSISIPARVATGFLTGEHDRTKREYVVRERDKHQWTEVYFNHIGWVKFDPTEFAENITPDDEQKPGKGKSIFEFLFGRGWLPPIALAAFIAMLAYVVKVELWDRFRGRRRAENGLALPETNLAVIAAYETACAALARRSLRKRASETAAEFLKRVEESMAGWAVATSHFERLTALTITSRYSGEESTADDVRLAREAAAGLAAALRSIRRRDIDGARAALESGA